MSRVVNIGEVRQREGDRLRSRHHLVFVATHGCAVCGRRPVQVHHLLHYTGGTKRAMGKRAGDDKTVPLCQEHHAAAHQAPASFETKYGLEATARHLWDTSPAREKTKNT